MQMSTWVSDLICCACSKRLRQQSLAYSCRVGQRRLLLMQQTLEAAVPCLQFQSGPQETKFDEET